MATRPRLPSPSGYDLDVPGLIECVPNFSEGRRPEVVEEIVHAIGQIDGVTVLDHSLDPTHHRSVVTFAGSAEPVVRAATAAVGRALELIDMTAHVGAHPRIGAVDVIPFVPLGSSRIAAYCPRRTSPSRRRSGRRAASPYR